MPIIAIEGLDAAGKHEQSKLLHAKLTKAGHRVVAHDFPDYSTATGKIALGLLKEEYQITSNTNQQLPQLKPLLLQALMTINRHEKYDQLLEYKRSATDVMICDRYFASGLAYGRADGLEPSYLNQIHRGLPSADLWILIDISPEESIKRRPIRRDEYETRTGFLESVRANYLSIFRDPKFTGLWTVINGMLPEHEVHAQIAETVSQLFGELT